MSQWIFRFYLTVSFSAAKIEKINNYWKNVFYQNLFLFPGLVKNTSHNRVLDTMGSPQTSWRHAHNGKNKSKGAVYNTKIIGSLPRASMLGEPPSCAHEDVTPPKLGWATRWPSCPPQKPTSAILIYIHTYVYYKTYTHIHLHIYIYTYSYIHTCVCKYMFTTTWSASPGNLEQAEGLNQQRQTREGQGRTPIRTSRTGYRHGHIGAPQHRFFNTHKIHIYRYINIQIYIWNFICMCRHGIWIYIYLNQGRWHSHCCPLQVAGSADDADWDEVCCLCGSCWHMVAGCAAAVSWRIPACLCSENWCRTFRKEWLVVWLVVCCT